MIEFNQKFHLSFLKELFLLSNYEDNSLRGSTKITDYANLQEIENSLKYLADVGLLNGSLSLTLKEFLFWDIKRFS